MTLLLRGMFPAFPTPLKSDGLVDIAALERLVEHQISSGAAGLVPLGGTGEGLSLPYEIRRRVLEVTVSAAAGRASVVAGVLDPGLGGALDTIALCHEVGADAVMVIPPYYARPDQAAVHRYFRAVAKASKLPIVLYDNPYRTNIAIAPETIAAMAEEGLIVGMKASSTDLYHFDHVAQRVGDGFGLLSGQDTLFVEQALLGATGGVLTSACLIPDYWNAIQAQVEAGHIREALAAQRRLYPFLDALFAEHFPAAVRCACKILGLPIGSVLPPVDELSAEALSRLERAVQTLLSAGILRRIA